MSAKPATGRDFQPCPEKPIVFGPGGVPEARERLLFEKVTELAFSQNETCRVSRERDSLAKALEQIAAGHVQEPRQFASEILARLASGSLRKVGA
ncbi:hypothetical protein [Tautonia marina]|uniref:hypothetical protein n=1 Tax=Tautonia marina TaxID=2653855 RepID=UPI0012609920|nr:hypothetical protein [Tautonia marina]